MIYRNCVLEKKYWFIVTVSEKGRSMIYSVFQRRESYDL